MERNNMIVMTKEINGEEAIEVYGSLAGACRDHEWDIKLFYDRDSPMSFPMTFKGWLIRKVKYKTRYKSSDHSSNIFVVREQLPPKRKYVRKVKEHV